MYGGISRVKNLIIFLFITNFYLTFTQKSGKKKKIKKQMGLQKLCTQFINTALHALNDMQVLCTFDFANYIMLDFIAYNII